MSDNWWYCSNSCSTTWSYPSYTEDKGKSESPYKKQRQPKQGSNEKKRHVSNHNIKPHGPETPKLNCRIFHLPPEARKLYNQLSEGARLRLAEVGFSRCSPHTHGDSISDLLLELVEQAQ